MKKTFRFKFNTLSLVVGLLCLTVLLPAIIMMSISLAKWNYVDNPNVAFFAVCFAISILIGIADLFLLLNSKYTVDENVKMTIGFLSKTVAYDEILTFRTNVEKTVLLMYYKKAKDKDFKYFAINVKNTDDFVRTVREHRQDIPYDIITKYEDEQ